MERKLCFIINNDNIFLEQVLVDYMGVPIFFLCKSAKKYYLVLCSDFEEYNYIIVEVSQKDIYMMFCQNKSMRDMFLDAEYFYEVISGDTIEEDIILKKKIEEIDQAVLPEPKAMYEILLPEVKKYCTNFNEKYLLNDNYYKIIDDVQISLDQFDGAFIYDTINRIANYTQYTDIVGSSGYIKVTNNQKIISDNAFDMVSNGRKIKLKLKQDAECQKLKSFTSFAA